MDDYPNVLPEKGIGEAAAYEQVSRDVQHLSVKLGSQTAFAHMDPPVPDIASRLLSLIHI